LIFAASAFFGACALSNAADTTTTHAAATPHNAAFRALVVRTN
jgi:hypothetical protein